MPFTPSHAVVALAFVRTPLVPAAIAVGAMTPDLPLFVRVGWPDYATTHDPLWVPATAAFALMLLLVWRCLLRPAAADLLPRAVATRLPATWDRTIGASFRETWSRRSAGTLRPTVTAVVLLVASLVVGVLSHVAWDVFTHEGRWGTELLPVLLEQWGPFPGFRWLQHGSSALGLAVLAIWAAIALRRGPVRPVVRTVGKAVRVCLWTGLPIVLVAAWVGGLIVWGPLTAEWTAAHLGYRVLPPAVAVWGAALLAIATIVSARRSQHREPRDSGGGAPRHARDAVRFARPRSHT